MEVAQTPISRPLVEDLIQQLYVFIQQLQNMDRILDAIPDPALQAMFAEDLLEAKRDYDRIREELKVAMDIYNTEAKQMNLPADLNYYRIYKNLLDK